MRKHFDRMQQQAQPAFHRSDAPVVRSEERFTSPRDWKMQVGDKVMITRGQFKGQVTEIVHLQSETNTVFCQKHSSKKVVVPKNWWSAGQNSHVIDYPQSFSPKDLKLVTNIPQEDGSNKLVAAHDVVFKGEEWDADYGCMMPLRRIKYNEHIIIPWPRPEPKDVDVYSTEMDVAHERTFWPTSLAGDAYTPDDLIKSLRHPLMKRPYKWGQKVFTESEIKKLNAPEMPVNEVKLKGFAEREAQRATIPSEPSNDTIELVGQKVMERLNSVDNEFLAKYLSKMGPNYVDPKLEFKKKQQALRDARVEENRQMNTIKNAVVKKYKLRRLGRD